MSTTRPDNLNAAAKKRGRNKYALYRNLLPLGTENLRYSSAWPSVPALFSPWPQLKIEAVYDPVTRTIAVTDEDDMQTLWRRGFFGKGSLSRSEPSWRQRAENIREEQRLTGETRLTAEEMTRQRREMRKGNKLLKKEERVAGKLARAKELFSDDGVVNNPEDQDIKKEDGLIKKEESQASDTVADEATSTQVADADALVDSEELASPILRNEDLLSESRASKYEAHPNLSIATSDQTYDITLAPVAVGKTEEVALLKKVDAGPDSDSSNIDDTLEPDLSDAEHLQLQPEEAFFLLFSLGSIEMFRGRLQLQESTSCLCFTTDRTEKFTLAEAWRLFLLDQAPSISSSIEPIHDVRLTRFDSPFLISYAVYHHYRSMGWVVRSGVKFCTDWVLYGQMGPVGGHAEFAVLTIPNYADPEDAKSCPFNSGALALAEGEKRNSWRYFHTVNRICSGVKKTLVLLEIVIPPLSSLPSPEFIVQHPAKTLSMYSIREVVVRRWMPGRTRD